MAGEAKKYGYKDGKVVAIVVSKSNGQKQYQIRKIEEGAWTCSCMAYRFSKGEVGKKFPCKHMREAFYDWKKPGPSLKVIDVESFM